MVQSFSPDELHFIDGQGAEILAQPLGSVLPRLMREAASMRLAAPCRSFAELSATFDEGVHFQQSGSDRGSVSAIVAPHGGTIEPGTTEIARAIAGDTLSYYCFTALDTKAPHRLHLTSVLFDAPHCIALTHSALRVVTVHGCRGQYEAVFIGGQDLQAKLTIHQFLAQAGVRSLPDRLFPGVHPRNICNRGTSKQGIQLEITEGLRRQFLSGGPKGFALIHALRLALQLLDDPSSLT